MPTRRLTAFAVTAALAAAPAALAAPSHHRACRWWACAYHARVLVRAVNAPVLDVNPPPPVPTDTNTNPLVPPPTFDTNTNPPPTDPNL